MKRLQRILIPILISMILVLFLTSCQVNEEDFDFSILTENEMIAVEDAQENGLVVGLYFGVDDSTYIIQNIMTAFNIPYTTEIYTDFSLMLDDAKNGILDIVPNITYSDSRSLFFDFTEASSYEELYLYTYDQHILSQLDSKNIGVQNDTIYESMVAEYLPEVNIVSFDTYSEGLNLLMSQTIDGVIDNNAYYDDALINDIYAIQINHVIPVKPVSLVAKKDMHFDLLQAISKYITTSDFRFEVTSFKRRNTQLSNRQAITLFVEDNFEPDERVLSIKYENNPPHAIFNENGGLSGVFPDILKEICEIIDFECEIQNDENELWQAMYTDLVEDRIDVLSPVAKSQDRAENLYFSEAIYENEFFMVKRDNYDTNYSLIYELVFEKIGVMSDDINASLLEEYFPFKTFEYYPTNERMIFALITGQVDYILLNEQTYFDYVIEHKEFSIVIDTQIKPLIMGEIGFAFPKTERGELLSELFNMAQATLDIDQIVNTYSEKNNVISFFSDRLKFMNLSFALLGSIVMLLFGALGYVVFVNRRTTYSNYHDYLTDLTNRRGFVNELNKWKSTKNIAIYYMDLNNFKHYNDLKGHAAGDLILVELANRLKTLESKSIIASRFSGDEFVVGFHTENLKTTKKLAEAIEKIIVEDIEIDNFKCYLSASIGVSIYTHKQNTINEVIDHAETAMQKAKLFSHKSTVFFDENLKNEIDIQSQIVEQLKHCIADDGFEMYYQPQMSIKDEKVVALEALLRIKGSKMSPGIFIPIAEKNGLMSQIGKIVIELVIKQMAIWNEKNMLHIPVFINISSDQLHDITIVGFIKKLLNEYKLNPALLGVEITEDVFIDKEGLVIQTLKKLKQLGLITAIDDFGSGQAGVNYLTNFEVDLVKIGKDVADKFLSSQKKIVYLTAVQLCESLGFEVLAEGIETIEQINLLKDMKVDLVQGYYYYKPMDTLHIDDILKNK
ncbi:MAG: EAL domain-containing protein [Acholeplasmataceae bacterium]|nr:EAL domain-containing protein [Acholeplasmataceae bacterium]